jgi:DNA-binding NtrC family response regulator
MAGGTNTVLVVDDDASIRLLCRVNLELDGYRVLEAGSVAEARAALDAGDVDVVLLDVHVGSDDGLAFLAELRGERPHLPVALLTGSSELSGEQEEHADAVIAKPFPIGDLTATVGRLAAGPGA